jgi:hypothetical protein
MNVVAEINLREVFESFISGICKDCNKVLEDTRIPDTLDNRKDIYENLIPIVVDNLVESPYFIQFRRYVKLKSLATSGVQVSVKTDTGRICAWKCMDSTSESAVLCVDNTGYVRSISI